MARTSDTYRAARKTKAKVLRQLWRIVPIERVAITSRTIGHVKFMPDHVKRV